MNLSENSLALGLAGFSFIMTVIWGGPFIRILRHFKIGKLIRVEGPERHFAKMGTPTMGGIMFIIPIVLVTLMLNFVSLMGITQRRYLGSSILLPLLVLIAYAVLGAVDDWEGIRGKRRVVGMSARVKFAAQVVLSLIVGAAIKYLLKTPDLFLPGLQGEIDMGWMYVPVAAFIITGFSNAINFTDGLDGLAGLISVTAFSAYGGIAMLQGQDYVARFCFTVVGAMLGFLWFNVHPAQLIMGDTGSLSLGATLAVVALMTGQWPLLIIIAVIPVSEVLSVIIQVSYFKITKGKRFFKMAPIHHHFELLGWSETQVVQRFWLISLIAAMIGIGLTLV